jgi:DNA-binding transcriptional ArsR family regulator
MEPERQEILLRFFKALANESRLKMIGLLIQERSVQELAHLMELRESTVSHHLSILKGLGLVRMRLDGNTHWYRADHDALKRFNPQVLHVERTRALAGDSHDKAWERKVLASFLDGERLKEIPASRKKRRVILEWLARRFEPGATYTEVEVNRILKRHHSDSATLRREMIGYRMFERNKGLYRGMPRSEWQAESDLSGA